MTKTVLQPTSNNQHVLRGKEEVKCANKKAPNFLNICIVGCQGVSLNEIGPIKVNKVSPVKMYIVNVKCIL